MRIALLALTACVANAGGRLQPTDVDSLRAMGPAGLQLLLDEPAPDDPAWQAKVDAVAAQKDAMYSGLYWYTDREEAVQAAAEQGKPVLSLRMLGELTDTWSCANSRFFRTVLYANPEVANELRDRFVLHWSSERSVPKITIDMGDGRELVSTVTGNSVHYVLDTEGRPIDALPGLYAPEHFLAELDEAEELFVALQSSNDLSVTMQEHHTQAIERSLDRLTIFGPNGERDAREAVLAPTFSAKLYDAPRSRPLSLIPASDALPMALGKMRVEMPITDAFLISKPPTDVLHPNDVRPAPIEELHPITQMLILRDQPAGKDGILHRFRQTLAQDSTWNRDVLHTKIRPILANGNTDFDQLNRQVYSEVFGTPAGDPWLGLYDPTVYSALPNGGISSTPTEP